MKPARTPFHLSRPVQAHGEEVDTLWLREPNAGDLAASGGFPFTIQNMEQLRATNPDDDTVGLPDLKWDEAAFVQLLSRIADVPRSTIAAISVRDVYMLHFQVAAFFFVPPDQEMAIISPPPSSIPASGSEPVSISPGSGDSTPPISFRSVGRS